MNQEALDVILQIIGWTGLIIISPFLGRFSFALVKYLSYKLFPIKTIYVEYKLNGVVLKKVKIRLDDSKSIVNQLKDACNKEVDCGKE